MFQVAFSTTYTVTSTDADDSFGQVPPSKVVNIFCCFWVWAYGDSGRIGVAVRMLLQGQAYIPGEIVIACNAKWSFYLVNGAVVTWEVGRNYHGRPILDTS